MNETLLHCLMTFGISMVPVIELRGAIPYGLAFGLPLTKYPDNAILNLALFIRKIFAWMRKTSRRLDDIITKLEERAHKKAKTVQKYKLLGLYILVAIPLPGTGAWTGSLVGALLDIRLKHLLPTVFAGVLTAGIVMCLISYGASALFSFV